MIVVMAKKGAALKTPQTPSGIINLEFAYDAAKTAAVNRAWEEANNNIHTAKWNTYFDFTFLGFYSLFLCLYAESFLLDLKALYSPQAMAVVGRHNSRYHRSFRK